MALNLNVMIRACKLSLIKKIRRELFKLLSYFGVSKTTSDYFGLKLQIPLMKGGVGANYIGPQNNYVQKVLALMLEIKEGYVLDVGANVGLWLVSLRTINTQTKYLGFEPNPVCHCYLQEIINENKFKNSRIVPLALSDSEALQSFYVKKSADKMGSLNIHARFNDENKYSFDVMTCAGDVVLDRVGGLPVGVIKVDVEGSELEVLRGFEETLRKFKPIVYCEIWKMPSRDHPVYNERRSRLEQLFSFLSGLNYIVLGVRGSDLDVVSCVGDFEEGSYKNDYFLCHLDDRDVLSATLRDKVLV